MAKAAQTPTAQVQEGLERLHTELTGMRPDVLAMLVPNPDLKTARDGWGQLFDEIEAQLKMFADMAAEVTKAEAAAAKAAAGKAKSNGKAKAKAAPRKTPAKVRARGRGSSH